MIQFGQEILDPLDKVGWLASQPNTFLQWAAQIGRWKTFQKGQFLYHSGDPPDGIYGLASGSLQLTFPLVGEEPVVLHRAELGFWVGDLAELAGQQRMVTIMAASTSRILHLPSWSIKILLANSPEHWRSFYQLNAINMRLAITLLAEALSLTLRARVCRRLLELSNEAHSASITQGELAKLLGVTRPTLRRCLTDLQAQGAIETHYRNVRVLDLALLGKFKDEQ
ncbi:MAG: Crp/Fnr family transcriptional regulator [Hyphomicrobiaceae bacterium]